MNEHQIAGCILGTAVGDAIGLPYEGVSRNRAARMLGPPDRHRFLFRRGMISDDTEHTCMVVQSLISSQFKLQNFSTDLARRLRWWFASLPAGIGFATARACLKLWVGVSPSASGVFSAGNGPAMRSAILGAVFDDTSEMLSFVRVSTRMTHSDPKAEYGATAVAFATLFGRSNAIVDPANYLTQLKILMPADADELIIKLQQVADSVAQLQSTKDFAISQGQERGVSGYIDHTVPIVIHAWLSHPEDYQAAVMSVIECGGDADTTAAIVGGIVGATTGPSGIPDSWLQNVIEWPRSVRWMRRLSSQLAQARRSKEPMKAISINYAAVLLRNILFLFVVLFHGFRRLLPPY